MVPTIVVSPTRFRNPFQVARQSSPIVPWRVLGLWFVTDGKPGSIDLFPVGPKQLETLRALGYIR